MTFKKGLISLFFVFVLVYPALAQRYAVATGSWTSTSTWATSQGGAPGASVPTAADDVYTEGFSVQVSGNVACASLYVQYDIPNGINFGLGTNTLTVNGELAAYDKLILDYATPTTSVIKNSSNNLTIIFTGLGGFPDVIHSTGWSASAPLRKVIFDPGVGNTLNFTDLALTTSGALTVATGTLEILGNLTAPTAPASVVVNTGATLLVSSGSITGNGTATTTFPTLTVNGTVTSASASTSFINAQTVTLNSGSVFNVGFNGANQTQGWWYQSTAPTTLTVNAASTINYNSSTAQNVFVQNYGNLILGGSGTITKTFSGSGSISLGGNLSFSQSTITLTAPASNPTIFNGTGAQSISGGGTVNLNGGLQVNKSAGTLTLSQNISVQNGIQITAGTLDMGSNTVTLSGNLVNNGTLTASSSQLTISGTTVCSGSSTTTLNSLTVLGSSSFTAAPNMVIGPVANLGTFVGASGVTLSGIFTNSVTATASSGMTFTGTLTNLGTFNAPSGTINVNGDFTNNGTFNNNSGTVTFAGSSSQSYSGSTSPTTFNHINVSNGNGTGLTLGTAVRLDGQLTLVGGGKLNANGQLTISSSNVSTGGMITTLTGSTSNLSGNVNIERYIQGQTGGDYRYLSVPISGGVSLGVWKASFGVTGNFTDPSTNAQFSNISNGGNTNASVYTYNSGTQAFVGVSAPGSAVSSVTLSPTTGYAAYDFSNAPVTVTYTGAPVKGNVSIPISSTNNNFSLVPNPYPSPIDWDNVTKTGLSSTMWIRHTSSTWSGYTPGVGAFGDIAFGGWTGEVAIGQAFWVQSTGGTATLALKEADKTLNAFEFLREATPVNNIRVTLNSASQKDDILIHFEPAATDTTDAQFDATKRKNGTFIPANGMYNYVNLSSYTVASAKDYSINSVTPISCTRSIRLKVTDTPVGSYSLAFSEMASLQLGYSVKLIDHFLNKEQMVTDQSVYSFSVTSNPTSLGDSRFELVFSSPVINTASVPAFSVTDYCAPSSVPLSVATQAGVDYQVFKGGVAVSSVISGTGLDMVALLDRSKLISGDNILDVKASTPDGCSSYTYASGWKVSLKDLPTTATVTDVSRCGIGSVTLQASGAPANGSYRWYADLVDTPIPGATGSSYVTPSLSASQGYYVSIVNSQGCESGRITANAVIKPQPIISSVLSTPSCGPGTVTMKVAGTPAGGTYKWYNNLTDNTAIGGATSSVFTSPVLQTSQSFFVSGVDASGCEGNRTQVSAEILTLPQPVVTAAGHKLTSSLTTGNQWLKDGQPIIGATLPTLDVTESGKYSVINTNAAGCAGTSSDVVMTITGLELNGSAIQVFPNPTTGLIRIRLPRELDAALTGLNVYDAKGGWVAGSLSQAELLNEGEKLIDITGQNAGLYVIKFSFGMDVKATRIMKQ
jgi:hypothetical protein